MAHLDSYKMGIGALFPEVKPSGSETDHSPLSTAEVKNVWSFTFIPPACLHGVVLN
jgi:hypothetical protein